MSDSKLVKLGKSLDELDARISELRRLVEAGQDAYSEELVKLERRADELAAEICSALTPWDKVMLARHERRPQASDYISAMIDDFIELHGDRRFGDDGAVITGLGFLDGRPVAVIGQQKGRTIPERAAHNFGMARPEGYRKTMRLMRFAAQIGQPIVILIDTPGADCLEASESRGISEAIAANQRDMFSVAVPVVCTVIGEGGSGGAIGIGVGDRLLMLEHSYYSVITPEGCAAILWRDAALREEAAQALKLTAQDALALGVIDKIVPEPTGGAHRGPYETAANLKRAVVEALDELDGISPAELLRARYEKFRFMGAPEGFGNNGDC